MEIGVRFRLHFADRNLLAAAQKQQGLKRNWLLLKPHLKTVSDLAFHLTATFSLHDFCPNGILLSIDGFVLPLFESTAIIKDKDLICVRRRGGLKDVTEHGESVDTLEVGKDHFDGGGKRLLLANEEFEKETGGYESEEEEEDEEVEGLSDEMLQGEIQQQESRKRKANRETKSPRRKKKRCTKELPKPIVPEVESKTRAEKRKTKKDVPQSSESPETPLKKRKSSNADNTSDKMKTIDKSKKSVDRLEHKQREERNTKLQKNGRCSQVTSQLPDNSKKGPIRSARCKKAKRRWLREKSKLEKESVEEDHDESSEESSEEMDAVAKDEGLKQKQQVEEEHEESSEDSSEEDGALDEGKGQKKLLEIDGEESSDESSKEAISKDEGRTATQGKQLKDCDLDDEIVPIEIRPGYIRFEPLSKGHEVQQNHDPGQSFQWNGITSKRKGQKQGTEKGNSRSWDDHSCRSQERSRILINENESPKISVLNFDQLEPYAGLPKKGDTSIPTDGANIIMVPRNLILQGVSGQFSWWEIQVGKVASYNPESSIIRLELVPEYPLTIKNYQDEEDNELESNTSPYDEDGSLEVEFVSLVDPRVIKQTKSEASIMSAPKPKPKMAARDVNCQMTTANGAAEKIWDDVIQVFPAKKLELSAKENGLGNNQNSGKSPWSHRAMRGSALGPIIARLREQNELHGN